jgi:hypothetical protein
MRGLTRGSIKKSETVFEKMDCRVKPGNDELTSEPASADQHVIAPPCALAGREE